MRLVKNYFAKIVITTPAKVNAIPNIFCAFMDSAKKYHSNGAEIKAG